MACIVARLALYSWTRAASLLPATERGWCSSAPLTKLPAVRRGTDRLAPQAALKADFLLHAFPSDSQQPSRPMGHGRSCCSATAPAPLAPPRQQRIVVANVLEGSPLTHRTCHFFNGRSTHLPPRLQPVARRIQISPFIVTVLLCPYAADKLPWTCTPASVATPGNGVSLAHPRRNRRISTTAHIHHGAPRLGQFLAEEA